MLFIGYPQPRSARRPPKELKAFARTGTLQPGESRDIVLQIPVSDLAYWAGDASGSWQLEVGAQHTAILAPSADPAAVCAGCEMPFTIN